jgi:hypothetical protein
MNFFHFLEAHRHGFLNSWTGSPAQWHDAFAIVIAHFSVTDGSPQRDIGDLL